MEAFVFPFDQRYELPPPAVRITLSPWQKVVGPPAVIVAVGNGFTVTVTASVEEHPPLNAVTV